VANITIQWSGIDDAVARLDTIVTNATDNTNAAITASCEEILLDSLRQVPRDTSALARSGYYKVRQNRTDTGGFASGFTGEVGYGGNGDPVNPISGLPASSYMVVVHEDMSMNHPHGGNAKFLENAVNAYETRFVDSIANAIQQAVDD
jgi:hypothetical protein